MLIYILIPAYNGESNISFFYNNLPQELQLLQTHYKNKLIIDAASDFKLNGFLTSIYDKGLKCQPNLLIGFSNADEYDVH